MQSRFVDCMDRLIISLDRVLNVPIKMTRIQALDMLCCATNKDFREIRRNYRLLVKKCHPEKWCDSFLFRKEEREVIFKGIDNAHELKIS